jgi:hypothetical protein
MRTTSLQSNKLAHMKYNSEIGYVYKYCFVCPSLVWTHGDVVSERPQSFRSLRRQLRSRVTQRLHTLHFLSMSLQYFGDGSLRIMCRPTAIPRPIYSVQHSDGRIASCAKMASYTLNKVFMYSVVWKVRRQFPHKFQDITFLNRSGNIHTVVTKLRYTRSLLDRTRKEGSV